MKKYNLAKLVKGMVLFAALATSVVACGRRNDNNQNLNAYQQSCTNCQNITGFPFFTAQTRAYSWNTYSYNSGMSINWSFSGQNVNSGQTQQQQGYYTSPAMSYSGQVAATGQVSVMGNLPPSMCPGIPAGEYSLATQTVGMWNQGQISGLRLVISGQGIQFTAILQNAQAQDYVYGYGSVGGSRIYGTMIIEQVNGFNCINSSFYLN